MLVVVALVPIVGGLGLWAAGRRWSRSQIGGGSAVVLAATAAAAAWAPAVTASTEISWGGELGLVLVTDGPVVAMVTLVLGISAAVIAYAVAHEDGAGLARLAGLLIGFAGAMVLLVLAGDLLTLMVGFELTAVASWGLIAHDWRDRDAGPSAAHAFNATRIAALGVLTAAGAAVAGVGSLRFDALGGLTGWPAHLFAAGMLVAAAAKSAQVPFSPWLFSAMAGPTPASALLHSATMVAAGVWALIRLADPLGAVGWFGPTAMALGLFTALSGGVVAAVQPRAKRLLAASTSAQYGLMTAAVGAGVAGAAMLHLLGHAVVKALLFLTAGVALSATGSPRLADHRLWRLRGVAIGAWVGALGLAAVPPLGAAFSKEQVVAALGHASPFWAVLGAAAGGLSALYAVRFAAEGFGPDRRDDDRRVSDASLGHRPGPVEVAVIAALAAVAVLSGVWWLLPHRTVERLVGLDLAEGPLWEVALSLVLVALGAWAASGAGRRRRLHRLGIGGSGESFVADWLGLPGMVRRGIVDPGLAVAAAAARVDTGVVDAGVDMTARIGQALGRWWGRLVDVGVDDVVELTARLTALSGRGSALLDAAGVDGAVERIAAGVGRAGRDARRGHTGLAHHYYALMAAGLGVTVLLLLLLR